MPIWLITIFTSKTTWYAIGAALLTAFLYFGLYLPYEQMKAQAALVPGLQAENKSLAAQVTGADDRVAKALVDLQIAKGQRDQAVADFAKWNEFKGGLDAKLDDMARRSPATTNAICLPSDDERQLWNQTLASLTTAYTSNRQAGTAGQVPSGPGGIH